MVAGAVFERFFICNFNSSNPFMCDGCKIDYSNVEFKLKRATVVIIMLFFIIKRIYVIRLLCSFLGIAVAFRDSH